HALTPFLYFPVRIEEGHVNRAVRIPRDVEFDDPYRRIVGPKKSAKAFQHDLEIIDECDTDGVSHGDRLSPQGTARKHPIGCLSVGEALLTFRSTPVKQVADSYRPVDGGHDSCGDA